MLNIWYGGTFDPPHLAHEAIIDAALAQCPVATVWLLPCFLPVHKANPQVSSEHRVGMLQAMVDAHPDWRDRVRIDDRELQSGEGVYTVQTLRALRAEYGPDTPLAFLLGGDSLCTLAQWQAWQELTALCHLLIYPRPGYDLPESSPVAAFLADKWLAEDNINTLYTTSAGKAWLLSGRRYDIASRNLRAQALAMQTSVPQSVLNYLHQHSLYFKQ
ncbi:nicotinate (nicotinamide) nucleotide adenylyltransferase [Salinispirillum marinum]|uniref:Probable nicotinate-nucleotide adenylyltransferase n=2 Tax=Saccharospirillaceae TaxID=255527 RepID=A0ABV8B9G4_9GAMM